MTTFKKYITFSLLMTLSVFFNVVAPALHAVDDATAEYLPTTDGKIRHNKLLVANPPIFFDQNGFSNDADANVTMSILRSNYTEAEGYYISDIPGARALGWANSFGGYKIPGTGYEILGTNFIGVSKADGSNAIIEVGSMSAIIGTVPQDIRLSDFKLVPGSQTIIVENRRVQVSITKGRLENTYWYPDVEAQTSVPQKFTVKVEDVTIMNSPDMGFPGLNADQPKQRAHNTLLYKNPPVFRARNDPYNSGANPIVTTVTPENYLKFGNQFFPKTAFEYASFIGVSENGKINLTVTKGSQLGSKEITAPTTTNPITDSIKVGSDTVEISIKKQNLDDQYWYRFAGFLATDKDIPLFSKPSQYIITVTGFTPGIPGGPAAEQKHNAALYWNPPVDFEDDYSLSHLYYFAVKVTVSPPNYDGISDVSSSIKGLFDSNIKFKGAVERTASGVKANITVTTSGTLVKFPDTLKPGTSVTVRIGDEDVDFAITYEKLSSAYYYDKVGFDPAAKVPANAELQWLKIRVTGRKSIVGPGGPTDEQKHNTLMYDHPPVYFKNESGYPLHSDKAKMTPADYSGLGDYHPRTGGVFGPSFIGVAYRAAPTKADVTLKIGTDTANLKVTKVGTQSSPETETVKVGKNDVTFNIYYQDFGLADSLLWYSGSGFSDPNSKTPQWLAIIVTKVTPAAGPGGPTDEQKHNTLMYNHPPVSFKDTSGYFSKVTAVMTPADYSGLGDYSPRTGGVFGPSFIGVADRAASTKADVTLKIGSDTANLKVTKVGTQSSPETETVKVGKNDVTFNIYYQDFGLADSLLWYSGSGFSDPSSKTPQWLAIIVTKVIPSPTPPPPPSGGSMAYVDALKKHPPMYFGKVSFTSSDGKAFEIYPKDYIQEGAFKAMHQPALNEIPTTAFAGSLKGFAKAPIDQTTIGIRGPGGDAAVPLKDTYGAPINTSVIGKKYSVRYDYQGTYWVEFDITIKTIVVEGYSVPALLIQINRVRRK